MQPQQPKLEAGRTNVSAFERLRTLPALFRGVDLTVRFQWDSKKASHYLWLWGQRGLVAGLGGHSDVFANLLVDPNPNWEAAMVMARPSAVVVGIECLRRAGWTTQIPSRPQVAIDSALPLVTTKHFDVRRRSPDWFSAVKSRGMVAGQPGVVSMTALRPAWALADMLASQGWGACGLQPDDIDLEEATERDGEDWARACAAFRLEPGQVEWPAGASHLSLRRTVDATTVRRRRRP